MTYTNQLQSRFSFTLAVLATLVHDKVQSLSAQYLPILIELIGKLTAPLTVKNAAILTARAWHVAQPILVLAGYAIWYSIYYMLLAYTGMAKMLIKELILINTPVAELVPLDASDQEPAPYTENAKESEHHSTHTPPTNFTVEHYSALSIRELKREASERCIAGYGYMKKAELVRILSLTA